MVLVVNSTGVCSSSRDQTLRTSMTVECCKMAMRRIAQRLVHIVRLDLMEGCRFVRPTSVFVFVVLLLDLLRMRTAWAMIHDKPLFLSTWHD